MALGLGLEPELGQGLLAGERHAAGIERMIGIALGRPQSAMIASPMNLSMVPRPSVMIGDMRLKYSASTGTTASPSFSESAVKPARSVNMTVIGRCMPPGLASMPCFNRRRTSSVGTYF